MSDRTDIWLPSSFIQDLVGDAQGGEDGAIYSQALESVLKEAGIGMAEYELARDDAGWMKLGINESSGLPEMTRVYSIRRARAYFTRDPLSKQAVRIWTDYALGRGIAWNAEDKKAGETLRKFWDDSVNEPILSNQGQRKSSDKLLVDGEIFFVFFEAAGVCKIRRIDPLEITEIITDPDDLESKKLYKREWTNAQNHFKTAYYPDWSVENTDDEWMDQYGVKKKATAAAGIIYHVPFNSLGVRGISLLFSAMDWAKAHRKFLEARSAITQAAARFAWKAKIKGSAAQVDAVRNEWRSTLASGSGQETNPPNAPAATFVENEGYDLTPIKAETGANAAQVDANMLLQIFGSAVGVFPHYFGAGEAFRLATATAMERPMRVQFEAYQQLWSDVYDNIFNYVLKKNDIPKDKWFVDIDFPPVAEKDANEKVKAIVEVIKAIPELDGDPLRKLLLTTLGVNNPDEVLADKDPLESAAVTMTKALKELRTAIKEDNNNGHGKEKEGSVLNLS